MQFIGTGDRILTENFVIGYLYTITFKTGIYSNSACIGIGDNFVMFQRAEPDLLFNLNINTADDVDTIELYDSGGGTNDYDDLVNRPQINSHTLTGNMSGADLGLQDTISDLDTIRAGAAAGTTAVQPAALSDYQPVISDLDTIRAGAAAGATAVQPADMTSALAAKQDALSSAQLDAVNSGITSTDVAQITTNENNISKLSGYAIPEMPSGNLTDSNVERDYTCRIVGYAADNNLCNHDGWCCIDTLVLNDLNTRRMQKCYYADGVTKTRLYGGSPLAWGAWT